ncbi:hypothetical protein [Enterovibrio baiacu]|uniref:hypothetical protein n=1 Tax=Enterovibrio baiacu TaxID=2491023 RepID=UPI003D1313E1
MDHHNSFTYKSSITGFPQVHLHQADVDRIKNLTWSKRNGKFTKTSLAFEAIALTQGITTDLVRLHAGCSNVPQLVDDVNKKIMNLGLMIVRVDPLGVPPNAAFHHWYLVEAPIQQVDRQMAANDPTQ